MKAIPCGYCKGVLRAIHIATETRKNYPDAPIHILGMLVHNKYVSLALDSLNIISHNEKNRTRMELLDEIDEGIVIFSAHGVSNEVYAKAREKGLEIIDATCVDVLKTKQLVAQYLKEGYEVLYIGVKNHPEAEGIINDDRIRIHLITSVEDVKNTDISSKIFVTNQTTMSIREIADILETIQIKYPHACISEEICQATRSRQEAVACLKDLDLLYIVGDPSSNNTRNLAKCADPSVKKICRIETVEDIDLSDLSEEKLVGVTAGASTPTSLYQQVISFLENYHDGDSLPSVTDQIL